MIKNYLKIALRNIKRYPVHAVLNISGMAIGLACAILLLLWVHDEYSYDRYYKSADRLYRVLESHNTNGKLEQNATTPNPLAAALKKEYPEIIRSSRYMVYPDPASFQKGDNIVEARLARVDNDFFEMFDIEFVKGVAKNALNEPYDIIITEELANKYFGKEDPMGKTMTIWPKTICTVTGVIKKLPQNSHFYGYTDCIVSFESLKIRHSEILDDWNSSMGYTFIELMKGTDSKLVEKKSKDIIQRNLKESNAEISLQSMTKIHLYSDGKYNRDIAFGKMIYVRLSILVALLMLTIACINFMNLSTAQSSMRVKEIGVRKVAGASKRKIIFQFLGESLLIVFVAHIIAMILVELLLPSFNNYMHKELKVNYQSAGLYVGLITLISFCGLLAGSYPAFCLSSLKPINIMKGIIDKNTGKAKFRRILVISQFTLSFLFILCTLIVGNQIKYIQSTNLGFNMDNIAYFNFIGGIQREALKNKLSNNPDIVSVTIVGTPYILNNWQTESGVNWNGKKEGNDISFHILYADKDYAKTFQIKLKEGYFLSTNEFLTDTTVVVINEKAAEIMGFKNPVGEIITHNGINSRIVGLIENFHFKTLHFAVDPLIIQPVPPSASFVSYYVKLKPNHITSAVDYIRNTFKSYNMDYGLDFKFLNDIHESQYFVEKLAGTLFKYLTFLAIIISCLGLIGLSTFMTLRRTKEIGIRKANGAKTIEIFSLLSKEYIKLVSISFIIASPIAWYATNMWLQSFTYHTNISWWVFAQAWLIVIIITMLTVGFQSYKAASKNPVEALRYE